MNTEKDTEKKTRTCYCQKTRCGRSWETRLVAPQVPAQCPYCKRYDWQVPDHLTFKVKCVCRKCGWSWESERDESTKNKEPKYCPGCKTPYWKEPKKVDEICRTCLCWVEGKCLRRCHKPIANKCKNHMPAPTPAQEVRSERNTG